jgi:hypothetical protein
MLFNESSDTILVCSSRNNTITEIIKNFKWKYYLCKRLFKWKKRYFKIIKNV